MIIDRIWKQQPGKYFCLSTKSATGKWRDHFFSRGELGRVSKFIEENLDKDVYFCPHGFNEQRRLKSCAVLPQLLWSDLDEADPRDVKYRPTVAIESSPGRFVGLWFLDGEMTEALNRRMTYTVGADVSGWDLTQVLRVPGTTNYKYESLPRTRIMWSDGPEYTVRELSRRLPPDEEEEEENVGSVQELYAKWENRIPHWCRRELMHGKPTQGKRSEMVWKLGNTLIECGLSREEAFTLLKASPWNKFRGRRNEDEQLRRELRKAIGKHLKKATAGRGSAEEDEANGYVWLARPLSEVEEEEIDWIWYPYLARGELSIMEGDPGIGKSYLAQIVSGHIADGKSLPSVKKMSPVQGKVVYFDIENSAGSITIKRVKGNGFVHLENYIQEEAVFSIDDEERMNAVYEALEKVRPTLVVFDTINTYLGKADAFKGHEAQQAFVKFRAIAKRFGCAVLVLRHLTKSTKERALYRGQGSIAFAGIARVVITVGLMPEDQETAVFAITKMNIAKKPRAHTFQIIALPDTLKEKDRSRFQWGEFVDLSSDDILAAPVKDAGNEREEGKKFLEETLGDGEMEVRRLERMAETRSISARTLQRAADEMGLIRKSKGFGKDKRSYWSLPEA